MRPIATQFARKVFDERLKAGWEPYKHGGFTKYFKVEGFVKEYEHNLVEDVECVLDFYKKLEYGHEPINEVAMEIVDTISMANELIERIKHDFRYCESLDGIRVICLEKRLSSLEEMEYITIVKKERG